jgi:cytidine deaminase
MPRRATDEECELYKQAAEARELAYAPYSDFAVGAALRASDGRVFVGANVENASYGLTICAERAAVCRAVAEGARQYDAIAVAADDIARTASPCGACRQVLAEFAPTMVVIYRSAGEVVAEPLDALLPASFELQQPR